MGTLSSGWIAVAGLFGMLLVLCEVACIETAIGTWLPARAVPWFHFLFWLLFICVVVAGTPEVRQTAFSPTTRIGVFVLLSAILLSSSNFRSAMEDLEGSSRSWWRIDAALLQRRGRVLEFQAPAHYPNLAVPPGLTADPGCWVNRCVAAYLGAESVVVKGSTERCP